MHDPAPLSRPVGLAPAAATAGFVALTLLMIVTLQPFVPPVGLSQTGNVHLAGDAMRQVCAVSVLAVIVLAGLKLRGLSIFGVLPLTLLLLLTWCLGSALLANEPALAFRRAAAATILMVSTFVSVDTIGHERALHLLRIVLVAVLVACWLSIPFIATAVHLPGETDPSLVGDWRGLFQQKNGAGAVMVWTILLFAFGENDFRRWARAGIIVAAFGFLIMTRSKTSLGLLPLALLAGGFYKAAWRSSLDRSIYAACALLVLLAVGAFALFDADAISRMLSDPAQFTGRTEIWRADLAYLHDHLLLGAGFGATSGTEAQSLLTNYTSSNWVKVIGSSHNGYLEVMVNLGLIGFIFTLIAVIILPLSKFWPLDSVSPSKATLFALYLFCILHNFTESDLLQSDNAMWFAMLLVMASLRERERTFSAGPALRSIP